jgi:transposase
MPASSCVSAIKKTLRYTERDVEQRIAYLRTLRRIVRERGAGNLVYLDESGFEARTHRPCGWARKGQKVYGERSGNARPRTSLIAAQCGKKLLAPVLFKGATNAAWFNHWLKHCLFPELPENATLIMDNAAFHKTPQTRKIMEQSPFHLLYLPKYSPDFNPIENVFAILKKRRQNATPGTTLDELIKTYENYLV